MCRVLRIVSGLDANTLRHLIGQCNLDASVIIEEKDDCLEPVGELYYTIEIEGIDDKCLCNLTREEKVIVYNFIDRISVI